MKVWKDLQRYLNRKRQVKRSRPLPRLPDWTGMVTMFHLYNTGTSITPVYSVAGDKHFYGLPLHKLVKIHPGAKLKVTIEVVDKGLSTEDIEQDELKGLN